MSPAAQRVEINVAGILASVDLVEVITAVVKLKKKGKSWLGCCPFHDEKTPSFFVDGIKQLYYCFGCQAAGDALSFVRSYYRLDFVAACEQLAGGQIVRVTSAEIQAALARRAELERLAEVEKQRIRTVVAEKALRLWGLARPANSRHSYLLAKGVRGYGLRQLREQLVVPVRQGDGRLTSLQFIGPEGDKTFLTGGQIQGGYCSVGKPGSVICICEGIATRDSIFMATGYATAAAFSAGNLRTVAVALRQKFPQAVLVLCADNDHHPGDDSNPGVTAARQAALEVNGVLAIPEFKGV
jgi:putative DNA primase/helicase